MSLRLEAEHIMQLALIPGSSRQQRSQRLIFQRTIRGERSLQNINIAFGSIIEQAVDGQTAALQGFAQFQTPDAVLREERLAEGLAWLAAEVGVAAPEYRPVDDGLPIPLSEIWDPELEDAAREGYARDYQSFGFGDWRKTNPPVA